MAIPIINVSILNGSNGFRLSGLGGHQVSSAGDINGDGFDDVMIGTFYSYPPDFESSASYVVFGKGSAFDATLDLSSLDGNNGFHLGVSSVSNAGDINGDGFDDFIDGGSVVFGKASGFGARVDLLGLDGSNGFRLDRGSVSNAGDVNGDGFDDLLVNNDGVAFGYVVFGKHSGFDATLELSSLDGSNGFRMDGAIYDRLGSSVSDAGDVNGDGFDDVIINAPRATSPNGDRIGSSYVVFGHGSGFAAEMDLLSLNGSNGFRLDGFFGRPVISAGDVNGDGFDDLIIGVPDADSNGERSGSSYVVFGKASGFDAEMDLSSLDGSNGFRMDGAAENDRSGSSVSSAGDVNGDGFDDLLVGAFAANLNGSSYVVFGKASGFDATLDLSNLNGNNGFRLDGADFSKFGASVSSAGDVNGDGFDDLMIGTSYGTSYVVFGGSFITGEAVYLGTLGNDQLVGTSLAERFEAGDGDDSMTGRGGADVFHGGAGDDTVWIPDLDFQLVDGGVGNDTLKLVMDDINLNLADFHDTIDGIETISLIGSGTLTLTLADLLGLSNTTSTFTLHGNADNRVIGLDSDGWTDGGIEDGYHIFTNQGTILRVDTDVRTAPPPSGVLSLADLDGSNGFRVDGATYDDSMGFSVSDAGDINGDGFDDVILSAPGVEPNGNRSGSSYVIFGKTSGFDSTLDLSSLNGTNGFRLDGDTYDYSGSSVSSAGDVNDDGFDDLIVGAPQASPNGVSSGSSYVVFGKISGFNSTLDLSGLDGSNGFRLDGALERDNAGTSVSNAGDVNGDGFDDLIVGASGADSNGEYSGSAYVVFGKGSGFSATMNLSEFDGNNGFRLDGTGKGEVLGVSVSNAGDVNGDGFDDVIVGAPGSDSNGDNSGSSYVVFGKATGFDAEMDLSSLNGSNGFRLDGIAGNDKSGTSVSGAGDFNGDGFDDLIVGAFNASSDDRYSGSSFMVFGKASSFDATLDLSSLDDSNGFRLDGAEKYDRSGFSVSGAGDVNGDGFDDVIIGAPYAEPGGIFSPGASYLLFGKSSGFDTTMNLSTLNGSNGFRLDGVSSAESGESVSGAGDINGDGFDDLIVGAPDADRNGGSSGSSYVIFGRSDFGGGNVIAGTPRDDNLTGTSAAERFEGGDGNDRMIGHGGADVFHGGAGNDRIRVSDLGFQLVDGGSGNSDVLSLGGSRNQNLDLDFADVRGKISGIEIIYLHGGSGDKTLTLTAADVLNLSDTSNTLKVNGNEGDRVILQGDWADGGIQGGFHTYTSDAAASADVVVLLVGLNVTADFA